MSQIMPFTDRDLEIRYSFGRILLKRLPRGKDDRVEIDGDVGLEYYRLSRTGCSDIVLPQGETGEAKGPTLDVTLANVIRLMMPFIYLFVDVTAQV